MTVDHKEPVVHKMYSGHPVYNSRKYALSPYESVNGTSLPQHLVHGVLGNPDSETVITGPCYLTPYEIRSLGPLTSLEDLKRITGKHPTFEDIACSAVPYPIKGVIYNWQETHHYARLVEDITGLPYEELIPLFEEEAHRIFEAQGRLAALNGAANSVRMKWTHDRETQEVLEDLSEKYAKEYLQFVKRGGRLFQIVIENPSECYQLQIISTYSPKANCSQTATAIESVQNLDNIWPAYNMFGTSAILLAEPKDSRGQKSRMNSSPNGGVIYLGPKAYLDEETKKLKFGTKTPFACGVFGLLWHTSAKGEIAKFHNACVQAEKAAKESVECQHCLTALIPVLEYLKGD